MADDSGTSSRVRMFSAMFEQKAQKQSSGPDYTALREQNRRRKAEKTAAETNSSKPDSTDASETATATRFRTRSPVISGSGQPTTSGTATNFPTRKKASVYGPSVASRAAMFGRPAVPESQKEPAFAQPSRDKKESGAAASQQESKSEKDDEVTPVHSDIASSSENGSTSSPTPNTPNAPFLNETNASDPAGLESETASQAQPEPTTTTSISTTDAVPKEASPSADDAADSSAPSDTVESTSEDVSTANDATPTTTLSDESGEEPTSASTDQAHGPEDAEQTSDTAVRNQAMASPPSSDQTQQAAADETNEFGFDAADAFEGAAELDPHPDQATGLDQDAASRTEIAHAKDDVLATDTASAGPQHDVSAQTQTTRTSTGSKEENEEDEDEVLELEETSLDLPDPAASQHNPSASDDDNNDGASQPSQPHLQAAAVSKDTSIEAAVADALSKSADHETQLDKSSQDARKTLTAATSDSVSLPATPTTEDATTSATTSQDNRPASASSSNSRSSTSNQEMSQASAEPTSSRPRALQVLGRRSSVKDVQEQLSQAMQDKMDEPSAEASQTKLKSRPQAKPKPAPGTKPKPPALAKGTSLVDVKDNVPAASPPGRAIFGSKSKSETALGAQKPKLRGKLASKFGNLNINLGGLMPGAAPPPRKESSPPSEEAMRRRAQTVSSLMKPAKGSNIDSSLDLDVQDFLGVDVGRSRVRLATISKQQRRPPTRPHRHHAGSTGSASSSHRSSVIDPDGSEPGSPSHSKA